jgi:predicted transposase YdaD
MMLNSDQFHRVYLDEIGDARDLPLGLALMALTVEKRKKAPDTARYLAGRVQKELSDPQENRAIMELLTTILIYTFNNLNRAEVEKMLAAEVMLQDTRFYQEVKAEGEVIGEKRGLKEGKLEGKLEERRSIVLLLLKRKTGKLSARTKKKIAALDLPKLEALTIAILDLETVAEVETWLNQH